MKMIGAVLLLIAAMNTPSYAQSCDQDMIESVDDDGSILIMNSGAVFKVPSPVDQTDTMLWLPTDDVLICNDARIINTDEDGETADVVRLR